jgi:hypothetical protein
VTEADSFYWMQQSRHLPTPEDGNGSSVQTTVVFRIPDNGQSPNPIILECHTTCQNPSECTCISQFDHFFMDVDFTFKRFKIRLIFHINV